METLTEELELTMRDTRSLRVVRETLSRSLAQGEPIDTLSFPRWRNTLAAIEAELSRRGLAYD